MDPVNLGHEPLSRLRHHEKLSLRGAQFSMALLGWVLGQAMIYHRPAPFLWIALLLVWPRWRQLFGPLMAGGILGTALGISYVSALLVLGWAFSVPIPWRRSGWQWAQWPLLGVGTASLFLFGHAINIFDGIIAVVVAGGAVLLYWAAERQIQVIDTGQGDQGTLITGLAAIGSVIAGLEGWKLGAFAPGLLVGGMLILVAAVLNGPGGGAVAGATLGLTLAVRSTSPSPDIGILVTGGFLAGFLAVRSWRLASLGLMSGIVLYAVLIQLPRELTALWLSLGTASVIVQTIPGSFVELGKVWAQLLVQGDTPDTLPARLNKISGVMQEMSYAFRIDDEDPPQETNLVEAVVSGVCRKCSLYRTCWEDEFYRSYRSILDLMSTGKEELLNVDDLGGGLEKRCIRPEAIIQSANIHLQRERERANFRVRVKESRALAERQLGGLAELIREMGQDFAASKPREGVKKVPPRLDYAVGVAKRPRKGGVVSGDSDLVCELSKNRVLFGLSDGMGVGPRAAWESGTAMSLLEQLLGAGFSAKLAVRAVNTTLLLRSVEDHFATLDLLLMDRIGRGAELIKVAAAPTFFCRQGRVEVIRSHSLPVGILNDVPVEAVYHTLNPGDVLVMLTDGALESQEISAEDKLRRLLKEMPFGDPQTMAETILSYMLGHDQDGRDDAAVIVVQILEHNQRRRTVSFSERDVPVREWQRLTPRILRTTC
ncbi:MAG: SpoIIE family protein phosphatase [Firmicutes bacterium]|nr:SpoIIE family protein phosphatase [Bacillota bacterium]MCL5014298.1 SpoIIE family protein phosphatase [Bacillota bacterium]